MRDKLERTTGKERGILQGRVLELIEERQYSMDRDIRFIREEYRNIRKVPSLKYNTRNLFIELEILELYEFYANAISNRKQFQVKNEKYYFLLKKLGL
jgi:hypothetical protein